MSSFKCNYLRISVTDYCNQNCIYCRANKVKHFPHNQLLRFEEILMFVKTIKKFGIEKVRITGGEPLIKRDILLLLGMMKEIRGLKLCLTTNGSLLLGVARDFAKIGIDNINVSLNTLNGDKFEKITGRRGLKNTIDGILLARDEGIPLKLNTVILKNINDDEVCDLVKFASDNFISIRFIEYMPTWSDDNNKNWFVPNPVIMEKISNYFGKMQLISSPTASIDGPAQYYKFGNTVIGFISFTSHNFCMRCNRIRLTADGKLRPCLFSNITLDARESIKNCDIRKIEKIFLQAIESKKHLRRRDKEIHLPTLMARIGG